MFPSAKYNVGLLFWTDYNVHLNHLNILQVHFQNQSMIVSAQGICRGSLDTSFQMIMASQISDNWSGPDQGHDQRDIRCSPLDFPHLFYRTFLAAGSKGHIHIPDTQTRTLLTGWGKRHEMKTGVVLAPAVWGQVVDSGLWRRAGHPKNFVGYMYKYAVFD